MGRIEVAATPWCPVCGSPLHGCRSGYLAAYYVREYGAAQRCFELWTLEQEADREQR